MPEAVAVVVGDQRPLVGLLLVGERMLRREDRAELRPKKRSVVSRAASGPSGCAAALPRVGLAELEHHRAVEEQRPVASNPSSPAMSRANSSVATEVPMSWAQMNTGLPVAVAGHQLLGQVGLPGEACRCGRAACRKARSRGSRRRALPGPARARAARASRRSWTGKPCRKSSRGPSPSRRVTWIPCSRKVSRRPFAAQASTRSVRLIWTPRQPRAGAAAELADQLPGAVDPGAPLQLVGQLAAGSSRSRYQG